MLAGYYKNGNPKIKSEKVISNVIKERDDAVVVWFEPKEEDSFIVPSGHWLEMSVAEAVHLANEILDAVDRKKIVIEVKALQTDQAQEV